MSDKEQMNQVEKDINTLELEIESLEDVLSEIPNDNDHQEQRKIIQGKIDYRRQRLAQLLQSRFVD